MLNQRLLLLTPGCQSEINILHSFGYCRVIGGVLIVAGLYSVLWGKHKENKEKQEKEAMSLPETVKGSELGNCVGVIEDITDVAREKAQGNKVMTSSE